MLAIRAAAEIERRRRLASGDSQATVTPFDWRTRVSAMFGRYFWFPFSLPHEELWEWANAIKRETSPRPFIAIWSRGRGKSTNAEAVVADCGVRGVRTYCMYVSGTQDQADKHVQTIARMFEQDSVARYAPGIGNPQVSKNGNRAWNRQVVSTSTGYTVEAIGLNKAVRGQKIDWARPDLIIFDDVDEMHDSALTTAKKEEIITDSILPAGAGNAAVMFVQNLIHADSIASKLAKIPGVDGAAGYLMNRQISGPFAAVEGLTYESQEVDGVYRWTITGGRSLWQGFDLDFCEAELNRVGPTSYRRESQHEVDADNPDALLTAEDFARTRKVDAPEMVLVAVAVDPPGGATECGIVVGGKARIGGEWHGYVLEDATQGAGVKPEQWALAVLQAYYRHKADCIFVERNYGGDMVAATIRLTKWLDDDGNVIVDGSKVKIVEVNATRGKRVRAEPVALVYQQGRGHNVGEWVELEKEWRQWQPGDEDSPNRLDAHVWLFAGLKLTGSHVTGPVGVTGKSTWRK